MEKPTIAELEEILASGKELPVEYLPSGEVRIKEDRMDNDVSPFSYASPDNDQMEHMRQVRVALDICYETLLKDVPAGALRTKAVRSLEQSAFWANKAICFPEGYRT